MHFHPLPKSTIQALRAGQPDANGQPAQKAISNGAGTPCRSCMKNIEKGKGVLIAAARPFDHLHPYAETGPIFLCEDNCTHKEDGDLPSVLTTSPEYLMKAYGKDEFILYGTGRITPKDEVQTYAQELFAREDVAYIDVRSSRNNCFLSRITRDGRPK